MASPLVGPRRIELIEYGEPRVLEADSVDLDALIEANQRWSKTLGLSSDPIHVETLDDGRVALRAEGVTGVVRVGNTDIEIAPKFLKTALGSWQTVLWRILTVVEGGHIDENLTAATRFDSMSMPDLLAEMFLASYSRGAGRGLPRQYSSHSVSGTVLRGPIDLARLDEWIARPWRIPYVADLLTDDTWLARLLRWTAATLSAVVLSPGRARALREVASGLSDVGLHPPHYVDAQRIRLGTQHQGLEGARLVGLLLLEGAGVHHASGEYSLSGFLWNSDTIYENYVFWLCRQAATRLGGYVNKSETTFAVVEAGKGSRLKTTPDVVFRDADHHPIVVMDSKYKVFGTRPKAPDTYQILTAAHVLGCDRVSLTYPTSGPTEATVWRVSSELGGRDIQLTALPLNLLSILTTGGHDQLVETIYNWAMSNDQNLWMVLGGVT